MKLTDQDFDNLKRKWTHSFEEDTETEIVYRPDDFVLPLSRGRAQFSLKENGEVVDIPIGRNDAPNPVIGTWKIDNENLIIQFSNQTGYIYPVQEITPERMVLKKQK